MIVARIVGWIAGRLGMAGLFALFIWASVMILPGGKLGLEAKYGRAAIAPWEILLPQPTATPRPTPRPTSTPAPASSVPSAPPSLDVAAEMIEALTGYAYDVIYLSALDDRYIGRDGSILPQGAPALIWVYVGGERFTNEHPNASILWNLFGQYLGELAGPEDEYVYFFYAVQEAGIYYIYAGARCLATQATYEDFSQAICDQLSGVAIMLDPDFLLMVGFNISEGGFGPIEESYPK